MDYSLIKRGFYGLVSSFKLTEIRNMLLEIQTKLDNISLVQEQPTPEFKRAFLVPYYQDKDYIRRPTLEHWLDEQEAGDNTRFSLVGLGGFGYANISIYNDLY